jgi:hypothetical protein
MSVHLLVCSERLRGPGRAERITVLSRAVDLLRSPELDYTDMVLALEDGPARVPELVHARHRITHVATFVSEYHDEAATIARELNAPVYPELGTSTASVVVEKTAVDPPQRPTIGAVVPVFAEKGEVEPIVVVGRRLDPDSGATVAYVAPHDGLGADATADYLDRAAKATRASGLRSGIATVFLPEPGTSFDSPDTRIAMPDATVRRLVQEAAGIDIADLAAQQAVGIPVLDSIRTTRRVSAGSCCAWLLTGPPGPIRIADLDAAEAEGAVRVEIAPEPPNGPTRPVRAIVWAHAADAGAAVDLARRAARHLEIVGEEERSWRW